MRIVQMLAFLALAHGFVGCAVVQSLPNTLAALRGQPQTKSCASSRLEMAFDLHQQAKTELANHFEYHDSQRLYKAYYGASDSMAMARSISQCSDRQAEDNISVRNLNSMNRNLQKIVQINLRDEDPGDLIALYGDQYPRVMPNDLQ